MAGDRCLGALQDRRYSSFGCAASRLDTYRAFGTVPIALGLPMFHV